MFQSEEVFGKYVSTLNWGARRRQMKELQTFMSVLMGDCVDTRIMEDNMPKEQLLWNVTQSAYLLCDVILDSDKKRLRRNKYFIHDTVRDVTSIYSLDMRETLVMLMEVAAEYCDRHTDDNLFNAIDAFNCIFHGAGRLEKFGDDKFSEDAFKNHPQATEPVEEPENEAQPKSPAGPPEKALIDQTISDGSLLESTSGELGVSVHAEELR